MPRKKKLKIPLLTKPHNLREMAFAKAFALLGALYMLSLGLLATYVNIGGQRLGEGLVNAIGSAYIGFAPSIEGSIIGMVWGAIDGFLIGYISAWLYNRFTP